jgi:hypothetical protein
MWFANRNDEGVVYHKYFNPIPVEVVVLVLTAVSYVSSSYVKVNGTEI